MPPAVDRTVYRAGGDQTIPRPRAWAHVDHPPPVHHPLDVITDDIAAVLAAEPKGRPAALNFDEARPSAVLVLLADGPGGAGVLLTRRSRAMRGKKFSRVISRTSDVSRIKGSSQLPARSGRTTGLIEASIFLT